MAESSETFGEYSADKGTPDVEAQPSRAAPWSGKAAKASRRPRIRVCLDLCKYNVIHSICDDRGWRECGEMDDWNLLWTDRSVMAERLMRMKAYQRINHFPGMYEITRKDTLAKNLNKARRLLPDEYDFYPASFYLPGDTNELRNFVARAPRKTVYISKPNASCQGRGIRLFKNLDAIDLSEPQVVQEYIARPYLIGGLKFDLRIYVVVLAVHPFLRVLVYHDGLGRFATEPYSEPSYKNLRKSYMHLTNYAINKHNDNFQFNEDEERDNEGSKWSLPAVFDRIAADGGDVAKLKEDINDIFIKTVTAILPTLQHTYASCRPADVRAGEADPALCASDQPHAPSNCFEVLGFDIMVDALFKPWLVEVNHSPSFTCDTPMDLRIKRGLIDGVLDIVNITAGDKRHFARLEKQKHMRRLYGRNLKRPPAAPAAGHGGGGHGGSSGASDKRAATASARPKAGGARKPGGGGSGNGEEGAAPRPRQMTCKAYDAYIKGCLARLPFTQIYPLPHDQPDAYYDMYLRIKNPTMSLEAAQAQVEAAVKAASAPAASKPSQSAAAVSGSGSAAPAPAAAAAAASGPGGATSSSGPRPERRPTTSGASSNAPPRSSQSPTRMPLSKEQNTDHLDAILRRALLEFEYGITTRSIVFKGVAAPVLLPQGPPRNDKIEKSRDAELSAKLRAMLKFGVREYAEGIVRAGQRSQQTASQTAGQGPQLNYVPAKPERVQQFYVYPRSRSNQQYGVPLAVRQNVPQVLNPEISTVQPNSVGNLHSINRIVRTYDDTNLPPVIYKGTFRKR